MTYKYCPKCGSEGSIDESSEIKNCPYCGGELKEKKEIQEDDFY